MVSQIAVNSELEKLLEDYSEGLINFTMYRTQRMHLIRRYVRESDTQKSHAFDNDTTQTIKPIQIEDNTFEIPTIQIEEKSTFNQVVPLAGIAALVTLAFVVWYFSFSDSGQMSADDVATLSVENSNNLEEPIVNEPFIEDFLHSDKWNSESLSNFLLLWQDLSKSQQESARKSEVFLRLGDSIKQQMQVVIKQKEAGNADTSRQEKLLIWFATELSLSVM